MGLVLNRPTEISVRDAVPILAELVDAGRARLRGRPGAARGRGGAGGVRRPGRLARPSPSAASASCAPTATSRPIRTVERHVRVFCGYAGWGAGQLEAELEQEAWIVAPALAGRPLPRRRPTCGGRVAAAAGRPVRACSPSCRTIPSLATDRDPRERPAARSTRHEHAGRHRRPPALRRTAAPAAGDAAPRGRPGRGVGDAAAERDGRQRRGRAPLRPHALGGASVGVALLASMAALMVAGRQSDLRGRRPVLAAGFVLLAAGRRRRRRRHRRRLVRRLPRRHRHLRPRRRARDALPGRGCRPLPDGAARPRRRHRRQRRHRRRGVRAAGGRRAWARPAWRWASIARPRRGSSRPFSQRSRSASC